MRFLVPFLLVSSAAAHASPLVEGRSASLALIAGAGADIAYLTQNADKCTRYGDRLREQFLSPLAAELQSHADKLGAFGGFRPAEPACRAPEAAHFEAARSAALLVAGAIASRLQQAATPQGQFFGYSGDQVMDLALEAAPGFPDCVPEEAGNPRSTRELRTYYAMKAKFVRLQELLEMMAREAEAPTAPVCL